MSSTRLFKVTIASATWLLCSSITQMHNRLSLEHGVSPLLLVYLQLCLGAFVCVMRWRTAIWRHLFPPVTQRHRTKVLHLASIANGLGHYGILHSSIRIAPAFTHTIGATESVFAGILAATFLARRFSRAELISIIVLILGVLLLSFSREKYHKREQPLSHFASTDVPGGIVFAVTANLFVALRNILVKYAGRGAPISYEDLSLIGFVLLTPIVLLSVSASDLPVPDVSLFLAVVCHQTYCFFSFYVLSHLDALSHSVITTASRILIVVVTGIYFHYEFNRITLCGTLLVTSGMLFYAFGTNYRRRKRTITEGGIKRTKSIIMP